MFPIEMSMVFFPETENSILKCIWNLKGHFIGKTISKIEQSWGPFFLISKLFTKVS